jgi:hypothetical protein
MSDELSGLAMTPVFLLAELFDSIQRLAERAQQLPDDDERRDFYVRLLPVLIAHSRQIGLPHPYETALFVVRLIDQALKSSGKMFLG